MNRWGKSARIMAAVITAALLAAGSAEAWTVVTPQPLSLRPLSSGLQTRPVVFSRVVMRLAPGEPYSKSERGLLCINWGESKWDGSADPGRPTASFSSVFNRELAAAGFNTTGAGASNMFDDAPASRAEFEVGAAITDLKEEACALTAFATKASVRMDIEWQVYSRLQAKLVTRIPTTGGARTSGDSAAADAMDQAFDQNVIALLNSPEFISAVGVSGGADQDSRASGESISIGIRAPLSVGDSVGSVVAVFAGDAMGSGWVVGDGYILTDRHVVGDAARVRIRWSDKLETEAAVLRTDARHDVALIKGDTRGRPPLAVRFDPLAPGEGVFAIGTPLDAHFQNTVTRGVVSALRTFDGLPFIQSDVLVTHGNSGGPLLDEKGRVVGLTDWGFQPEGAPPGLNLFTPVRDAFDFLKLKLETKVAQN